MTELVLLDGKPFVEKIPLRSLLYAEGLFETFRWKNSPPVYLEKHLVRMKRGAEFLSIPFPSEENVKKAVHEAINKSGLADAYVKICLLSSGSVKFYEQADEGHVLVIVKNYEPPKNRMRANVVSFRRASSSLLLRVKSMNYLENVLARRKARDGGYDEAIFLNERGEVAEGSTTNIFWVKKRVLCTPDVDCGLLPGITREALISLASELGLEVKEGKFELDEVLSSDGAFLTNSLAGIAALTEVDNAKVTLNEELFIKLRDTLFRRLRWVS